MSRPSRTSVRGLFRDKQGRWNIDLRWHEPTTGEHRRHRERLPSNLPTAAVKRRAREILTAALAGGFDPKRGQPKRLGEAFREYERWCETNRPNRIDKRRVITTRLLASLGDVPIESLSVLAVERFKRERAKEVKPATVNRDLEVLRHFIGLAVKWDWLSEKAGRLIREVPRLKEPPGRVRYLTDEEEIALMKALPLQVQPMVRTALLSGMRREELVRLQKNAVDLKTGVITLTRTKSNKIRRIFVNDELSSIFFTAMARSENEYVFVNRFGNPYTPDGFTCILRRAIAKAKIEDFRPHDLRHTTATRLRAKGVGIDVIADVLGHSTLAMAQRYTHIGAETMREAMSMLQSPTRPSSSEEQ